MGKAEQLTGPLSPGPDSRVVSRPLGLSDVEITGGPWEFRQRVNRATSVPLALEQLEKAGNFHDLRLVTGDAEGEFRGPQFMDSDLYKTLEAVGWELGRGSSEPAAGLTEFVEQTADLLERAQAADGYLTRRSRRRHRTRGTAGSYTAMSSTARGISSRPRSRSRGPVGTNASSRWRAGSPITWLPSSATTRRAVWTVTQRWRPRWSSSTG